VQRSRNVQSSDELRGLKPCHASLWLCAHGEPGRRVFIASSEIGKVSLVSREVPKPRLTTLVETVRRSRNVQSSDELQGLKPCHASLWLYASGEPGRRVFIASSEIGKDSLVSREVPKPRLTTLVETVQRSPNVQSSDELRGLKPCHASLWLCALGEPGRRVFIARPDIGKDSLVSREVPKPRLTTLARPCQGAGTVSRLTSCRA